MDKILQKYILRTLLLLAMLLSPMMATSPGGVDTRVWLSSEKGVIGGSWQNQMNNVEEFRHSDDKNQIVKNTTNFLNFHYGMETSFSLINDTMNIHPSLIENKPIHVFSVQNTGESIDTIFYTKEDIDDGYAWGKNNRVKLCQSQNYKDDSDNFCERFSPTGVKLLTNATPSWSTLHENVDSILIAEGYKIQVFHDANLQGKTVTYSVSQPKLDGLYFDNDLSASGGDDVENDVVSAKVTRLSTNTGDEKFPNRIISIGSSIESKKFTPYKYQEGITFDPFQGDMYEVILTKNDIGAGEIIKIQSYLSLKYGITYAHDYVSSSGVTFYTLDNDYQTNIFALGRDETSGLHQKVAQAEKMGKYLTISTTTDFTSLNSATRTSLVDGQFFVISDNDKAKSGSTDSTKIIDSLSFSKKSDRIWRVQNTGSISTLSMEFDSSIFDNDWVLVASTDDTFSDAKILAPLKGGQVSLKGLDSFGSVFYLRLYKKSNSNGYTVTTEVTLPSNDKGEVLLNYNKIGIEGLEATTQNNIYTVSNSHNSTKPATFASSLAYNSSDDVYTRYSVSEIKIFILSLPSDYDATNKSSSSTEELNTTISCLNKGCENIKLSEYIKGDNKPNLKITYLWSIEYRLNINGEINSTSLGIPYIRTTYLNKTNVDSDSKHYWIPHGAKVEIFFSLGTDNSVSNELKITGLNNQIQYKDMTEETNPTLLPTGTYKYVLIANAMSVAYVGDLESVQKTKVYEFETVIGEPFTLDKATLSTVTPFGDMKLKERLKQVSTKTLKGIQTQGEGYKPISFSLLKNTPSETTMLNTLIYDGKDNNTSDMSNFGRNHFIGNLYFMRPGIYRLEWILGGDDFTIGTTGIKKLVIEVNVKWPQKADYYHIAETPDVSLDKDKADSIFFNKMALAQKFTGNDNALEAYKETVPEISISNKKAFSFPRWLGVDHSSVYRSVLYFTKSLDLNVPATGDIDKEQVMIKVVETRHWSNPRGTYPLEDKEVTIASEIKDSEHNLSVGHNGFVMQTEALSKARYNPSTYNSKTMKGEIFAINQEVKSKTSAKDGKDDIVVAWYEYFAEGKLAWANKAVRYSPKWGSTDDRIVIASRMGTDGLNNNNANRTRQLMFDGSKYSDVAVYVQNDPSKVGYNPNEEHALIQSSFFHSERRPVPKAAFALRHDLNKKDNTSDDYTSKARVLVQYKNKTTGKYAMKTYTIQNTDSITIDKHKSALIVDTNNDGKIDSNDGDMRFNYTFNYPIFAGELLTAPYPLNQVIAANSINEIRGDNAYGINGYWKDKNAKSWAIAGGTKFDTYFWYPMLSSFWHPDKSISTGDIVPFTDNSYSTVSMDYSKNKSPYFVSKGVNYKHFKNEFKITYNSFWRKNLPEVRLGETITFAGGEEIKDGSKKGLPSVVAWASAEVIYDEMNKESDVKSWTNKTKYSVNIRPAVRQIAVEMLSSKFPPKLEPATNRTVNKGGKWFFNALHAGLKQRVYFDQANNKLVLRGILNDKFAEDPTLTKSPNGYNYILQPNILSANDIDTLLKIPKLDEEEADKLRIAFKQLYALSLNPSLNAEDLGKINKDTKIKDLPANYTVGLSRFLRNNKNKFLVVSNIGKTELSDEMKNQLPNGKLPKGLTLDDIEAVTIDLTNPEVLPIGISIQDGDTITALGKNGNTLVRIKEGKGYIPASQLGTGLALFTNPNLLVLDKSDFNGSHIVIAENNDHHIKGSAIKLHIMKVNNRPYRGQIKTILSENVFDEKITLRHTGDFGGNIENLVFEWRYMESKGLTTPPPKIYGDPSCPKFNDLSGKTDGWGSFPEKSNELVFGKASGSTVLVDNTFYVRYREKTKDEKLDGSWSGWAGAGGNKPCTQPKPVYKPQLVAGWVKRVTDGVNVFDTRIKDFSGDGTPATYVSMIEQIGAGYVGKVALNADKNAIENTGLAALYQTVLSTAKDMSINASTPATSPGVVQALQNAASRISQFYMLLGNEAYSDALDPTIGFKSSEGTYGNLAPTIFTFQNQVATLAQEELVLLRGREGSQEGDTGAAPVHNRFLWNFTNSDGEAAYALSYNIKNHNDDSLIDYKDAKIMYPQGHGDAWGHYLTALQTYYKLLGHSEFNWVSRAEGYEIDGITLDVDYLDERRFAEAAAAKAKVGSEVLSLTYRQRYEENPEGQWQGYTDTEAYRAWGVEGWVKRSHIGAYLDWMTANALLPAEDNRTGIQKIDRTTVGELQEIAINGNDILTQLAQINAGQNPLGLLPDVVPFDIDPNSGDSQFEQVYARAEEALKNAKNVFDYANELQHRIRGVADSQEEFDEEIYKQDLEYNNRLIEIFGTPYEGVVGAGKSYPEGYSGPDIKFYQYIDVANADGDNLPKQNKEIIAFMNTLGKTTYTAQKDTNTSSAAFKKYYDGSFPRGFSGDIEATGEPETVKYPLSDSTYAFNSPSYWGKRPTPGSIQMALTEMVKADVDMRLAEKTYTGLIDDLKRLDRSIVSKQQMANHELEMFDEAKREVKSYAALIGGMEALSDALEVGKESITNIADGITESFPKNVGTSTDPSSFLRGTTKLGATGGIAILSSSQLVINLGIKAAETSQELEEIDREKSLVRNELRFEIKEILGEIDAFLDDEPAFRLQLFSARESVRQTLNKYLAVAGKGLRLLDEREAFNKKVAAKTQGKRYQDMAFRLNRTEASQKYRAAFDLAAKYAYLAAKAYDYETNLSPKHVASAQHILKSIVQARTIGEVKIDINGIEPVVGQGGLADIMARLKANFKVLKTQMGMNNPQLAEEPFSLRRELFRISEDNNLSWEQTLAKHYTKNIWELGEFRTHMRPFAPESKGDQPGIVIPFTTNITSGLNFFGFPLSANDHAYDASQYSTKIRSVGITFEGYKGLGLASTARAYLVPVGLDIMLVPDSNALDTREWDVKDQKIPVPLPFGKTDMERSSWLPLQSLSGGEGQIRRHSRIRVHHDSGTVDANNMQTDSRLYGRSVWNSRWLLVIPGESLLNPAEEGLQALIHGKIIPGSTQRDGKGISDIKLTFETYSYSGN